jgi:hypothetical protein
MGVQDALGLWLSPKHVVYHPDLNAAAPCTESSILASAHIRSIHHRISAICFNMSML